MNNLIAYQANRDLMQTGDKIEFASASIVGWGIMKKTGQQVNHTSTVVCIPHYGCIKEPHIYIMEANPRGSEFHRLSAVLEKHRGSAYWAKIKATEPQRYIVSDWQLEHEGIPYDYKSLFKNLIARVNEDMNKLFCSEMHFIGCQEAGLIPKTDKLVPVPGTFEKLYPNLYYGAVKIL